MATLTGNTIASTYTGLLSVTGAVGADTVEAVTDGAGTSTSLSLSQQRATITLGSGAADDFIVDGTTLVVEGDNNRVGIGTASPSTPLEVHAESGGSTFSIAKFDLNTIDFPRAGTFRIGYGNSADYDLSVKQAASSGLVKYSFDVRNNGTDYANNLVLTNGRVGINDTSPGSPLDVKSGEASNTANFNSTSGATNITFESSGSLIGQMEFVSSGTSQIVTRTSATLALGSNNVQTLFITDNDNVGIGCTNPANKLNIQVSSDHRIGFWGASTYSAIQSANDANNAYKKLRFDASEYHIMNGNVLIGTTTNVTDPDEVKLVVAGAIECGIQGATNGVNLLYGAYSGNDRLNVFGSLQSSGGTFMGFGVKAHEGTPDNYPFVSSADNYYPGRVAYVADGDGARIFANVGASDGSQDLGDELNLTERVRFATDGDIHFNGNMSNPSASSGANGGMTFLPNTVARYMILIGSSSDGNNVDLIRFFAPAGSGSDVGSISTSGNQTNFETSSDYRLKENEVSLADGLTKLNQLKPYNFNWKIKPDEVVDGFFAHEVQEIVPFAVSGEKDRMETLKYEEADDIPEGKKIGDEYEVVHAQKLDHSKLVPLLVKALQEADDKIDALTARIEALEA